MLVRSAQISSGRKRRFRKFEFLKHKSRGAGSPTVPRSAKIVILTVSRSLQTKASRKHPKEYAKARARFPSPEM